MIVSILEHIKELEDMKKYPKELYAIGNQELLKRPKVSIVGTRRPSNYTKQYTYALAQALSKRGVAIVSGVAMGVDAIAHHASKPKNSIAVVANSLDIRYPAINKNLIEAIERQGLILSQFPATFRATPWSFVVRNELVVALGDVLIVTEADENSGSMRSVEFALKMGKKIYVLPQRLDESRGTNMLLEKGLATAIYNIEAFANSYGVEPTNDIVKDEFFYFCQKTPTLDSAIEKFEDRVYEAELEGIIKIEGGLVYLV
ncbi:Rossmann fold nucleotide-binding protein Smf possibly involved in DNA uptake [hydrothermal vent metagenome]|uniref:Rossmann fold nucleotide-binding protein Smf possibly involved in DNA uptake n=1 Tax=hydrothermal vent metagenome TaxID=652676 RepID=A0A1W1C5D5_9ZZZZ